MIITKELLIKMDACAEGKSFCERNKLYGFDLDRLNEVRGDYRGFINWLRVPRSFDADSRTLTVENYAGSYERFEYDERGNKIKTIHPNGGWVKWEYDERGHKVKEYYPNENWIKWEYDERGHKVMEKNASGVWTKWEYDEGGNKIIEKNPNGYWIKFKHDANGNIIEDEDCNGDISTWVTELYPNGQLKRIDELYIPLI